MFSSAGKSQESRGRTMRIIFRSIGIKIKPASKARTMPAPRESHTENPMVLSPANFLFVACGEHEHRG